MVGLCTSSDLPKCYEPRAVSMTPDSRYSASKNYIQPGTAISRYFFLNVHSLEMWRSIPIFKQNRERYIHALEYMRWKSGVSVWLFGSHRQCFKLYDASICADDWRSHPIVSLGKHLPNRGTMGPWVPEKFCGFSAIRYHFLEKYA